MKRKNAVSTLGIVAFIIIAFVCYKIISGFSSGINSIGIKKAIYAESLVHPNNEINSCEIGKETCKKIKIKDFNLKEIELNGEEIKIKAHGKSFLVKKNDLEFLKK